MSKYRKKPVVIEAFQLGAGKDVPDWFMDALSSRKIITHANEGYRSPFNTQDNWNITATIKTLEGEMIASNHDYIIQGVNGEIYPCKPDIFAKTYELADTPAPRDSLLEALKKISAVRGEFASADDPSPKGFMHMACDIADKALAAYERCKEGQDA